MPGGLMQRTNVVACSTCGLSNLANLSPWPRPTVFRMFGPYPQCNDDCPNGALDPDGEPHRTDCGANCDSGMCLPRYGLPPPGLRIPDMYERCTEMGSNGNNGVASDGPLGPDNYSCMAPKSQGGTGAAAVGCNGNGALPIREIGADMADTYYLSQFGPGWDAKAGTGALPTPAGRPGYAGAARIHLTHGMAPPRDEWVVNKGSMPVPAGTGTGQREGFCNVNAPAPMTPIPHDFVPTPPDPPVRNAGALPPAGPQSIGSKCSGQHVSMNTPEDTARASHWAGTNKRPAPLLRPRQGATGPAPLVPASDRRFGATAVDTQPTQAEWLQLQENGAMTEQERRLQAAQLALRARQWQGFQYKDGPITLPMEGPPQPCPNPDNGGPAPSFAGFRFVCTAPTQPPAGGAVGCRAGGCTNPPRGVCNSADSPPQGSSQCSEMSQWSPYAFNRALSQCMRTCRFQPYPKGIGACTRACQRASYGTEYPFF